jgi:hypothetical protein
MLAEYRSIKKAQKRIGSVAEGLRTDTVKVTGVDLTHDTSLVAEGLVPAAAAYFTLSPGDQEQYKWKFDQFLEMNACALYAGDIRDRRLDRTKTAGLEGALEKAESHFLGRARSIASVHGLRQAFDRAERAAMEHQEWEAVHSKLLKTWDYRFVPELFKKDPTLEELTFRRTGVLFDFIVVAAYAMFLKKTGFAETYPRETVRQWARYSSISVQEGGDDMNDLGEDLSESKPTPVIMRGIAAVMPDIYKPSVYSIRYPGVVAEGIKRTEVQLDANFGKLDRLELPPVLRLVTKEVKSRIRTSIKVAKKHH